MSGGDKLGFLKTDSLSLSKYINASLCCLRKTQNRYIKSSAVCVHVGSKCVALIALQEFRADKRKASNPRPRAPHPTRRLRETASVFFSTGPVLHRDIHVQKCLRDIEMQYSGGERPVFRTVQSSASIHALVRAAVQQADTDTSFWAELLAADVAGTGTPCIPS